MITKNIRITESQEQFLLSNYKNISQGISACIDKARFPDSNIDDVLKTIRAYTKRELKGKFSQEEWSFFADSLNGTISDGIFRCNVEALAYHCQDAEDLDGTATKWGVDIDKLIEKVRALTSAQIETLYWFVEEFWNAEHEARNLEKWATELV